MALETGNYIADLNQGNPVGGDTLGQADDHMRLIKKCLKQSFPNVAGAVNATHSQLNELGLMWDFTNKRLEFSYGHGIEWKDSLGNADTTITWAEGVLGSYEGLYIDGVQDGLFLNSSTGDSYVSVKSNSGYRGFTMNNGVSAIGGISMSPGSIPNWSG